MSLAIRVTPQQLQELSTRVNGGGGQIEAELTALTAVLAPLGSDWAGVAQARFLALWAEWQRSAAQLHVALSGISTLLQQAGAAYAEAENQIAATFAL